MRWAACATTVILAALLAGCTQPASDPGASPGVDPPRVPAPGTLRAAGAACTTHALVITAPLDPGHRVGPFERADIRDDLGEPLVGTFGVPLTGPVTGNWHVLTRCDDGPALAWVGVKIQPPAFDERGPPDQFVASGVFLADPPWVAAAWPVTEGLVDTLGAADAWRPAGAAWSAAFDTAWMGRFRIDGAAAPTGAEPPAAYRLWVLVPTDGSGPAGYEVASRYRPVAVDVHAPEPPLDVAAGPGTLRHHLEGAESEPVTTHQGNGHAVAWRTAEQRVVLAAWPGLALDSAFTHHL